jgi:hypothetical protein
MKARSKLYRMRNEIQKSRNVIFCKSKLKFDRKISHLFERKNPSERSRPGNGDHPENEYF